MECLQRSKAANGGKRSNKHVAIDRPRCFGVVTSQGGERLRLCFNANSPRVVRVGSFAVHSAGRHLTIVPPCRNMDHAARFTLSGLEELGNGDEGQAELGDPAQPCR
jgi:hypothetical protein